MAPSPTPGFAALAASSGQLFGTRVNAHSGVCRTRTEGGRLGTSQRLLRSTRPSACTEPSTSVHNDTALKSAPQRSVEPIEDGMHFFRLREGTWSSHRVTHHLAFRRSESGTSEITMKCLASDDEKILQLLDDNNIDRDLAQGGCYVTWRATMAWDQEGENHEGSTVFALVPDSDDPRRGRIIRDRGYAEVVPIAGQYYLDDEDALCLSTPYDGGAVEERFAFDTYDNLHRVSTVKRFGGLSNATFATERKIDPETREPKPLDDLTESQQNIVLGGGLNMFGGRPRSAPATSPASSSKTSGLEGSFLSASRARMAAAAATRARAASAGRPSPGSAFGSGFSSGVTSSGSAAAGSPKEAAETPRERTPSQAELDAGIDLSKVPPSMRGDFEKSLGLDSGDSDTASKA